VSGVIAKLRRALDDEARNPRYIETLSKRGYRLLVQPVDALEIASRPGGTFTVGDWLVEPSCNRMRRGDTTVELERSTMDVLLCLAERAGETVAREELVDRVWRTDSISEFTVGRRVAELEEALGGKTANPGYIETVSEGEYRLAAAVALSEPQSTVTPFPGPQSGTERVPYPGLSAFTEADADVFFGRDAEIAAMWRRIAGHRLLAVVGPSGVGKSSFVRAGVIPTAPVGWRHLICTPGDRPLMAIARALAPQAENDPSRVDELLRFDDPDVALATLSRWRATADHAMLVVDQFEELFTLNPRETQTRFVELLIRLVTAARIHVVLVMRDDFLSKLHAHPQLAPVFRELTVLGPPGTAELRRALVEPAQRRGYRFEDDALPDEMVTSVAEERGSLPLLAFAARRMWELRDRERRLLTRSSYDEIGGVTGALAGNAEAVLRSIGNQRLPVVRELFRNLVTAQGTRALRSVDDLLSVFAAERRDEAARVLDALIDARLLTSFDEMPDESSTLDGPKRVEIVHESLLREWPRLVGWQIRDADAARLRDQLRQAAQLWEARGRPRELLWTGAPYREFRVWRDTYPGGLSTSETAFADAMAVHARRRKRRRRLAAASVLVAAVAVAAVTSWLWRRSELQTRRLESRQLIEDARRAMDRSPPIGFASALASLEVMDSREARRLALEALWRSPMPLIVDSPLPLPHVFTGGGISPDGMWLVNGYFDGMLSLVSASGGPPIEWQAHDFATRGFFLPDSLTVMSITPVDPRLRIWTVPDHRLLGAQEQLATPGRGEIGAKQVNTLRNLARWIRDESVPGGWHYDRSAVPVWNRIVPAATSTAALASDDSELIVGRGDEILSVPLENPDRQTSLARVSSPIEFLTVHREDDLLATSHSDGTLRLWALGADAARPLRSWRLGVDGGCNDIAFDPSGMLIAAGFDLGPTAIRGLDDPPGSDPLFLLPGRSRLTELAFHPDGGWLVETRIGQSNLWPLERRHRPFILRGHASRVERVVFGADSRFLYSYATDGTVRQWPLSPEAEAEPRVIHDWGHPVDAIIGWVAPSPDAQFVVTTGGEEIVRLVSLDGSEPIDLGGFDQRVLRASVSPDGRSVAAAGQIAGRRVLRVWDLESGSVNDIDLGEPGSSTFNWLLFLEFLPDGRLLVAISGPLYLVDPVSGNDVQIANGVGSFIAARQEPVIMTRSELDSAPSSAWVHNLATGTRVELTSHGHGVSSVALDATGSLAVTGGRDGIIRVGPASGEEPMLLVGPSGSVMTVDVSPDGRWIASGHGDGLVRLWPMPDLERAPIHDLPRDQLLAKLRPLTNLRVVRDPDDPGGHTVTVEEFPGWLTTPEW
jgi:DNA-binding winged helix-turn-helix (wHTH) protein/WD40 repeat protein